MTCHMIRSSVLMLVVVAAATAARSEPVLIENASFEMPAVDPNAFPAVPLVDGWTEVDVDMLGSTNTGVFANTAAGSPDHVNNADGGQLAFLGSQQGNALEQDLEAVYKVGCDYRLTVGMGVSMLFPPATEAPVDTLELVLYYRDDANTADIVSRTVEAPGLLTTHLQDFWVCLPAVQPDDVWAGKTIGVAIRATGAAGGFWDLDNVRLMESFPVPIRIENASFESPFVDPNAFPALPMADGWTELDNDLLGSTNTGVFANTAPDSWDHMNNADGRQLAFLGSEQGNGFEQDLGAIYRAGCDYRLVVGVGVSGRFPPSTEPPIDTLELVLYYRDDANAVDVARRIVDGRGLSLAQLRDFCVCLPAAQADDAWVGNAIGVAIRATGMAGGFWDLDNVRLTESWPARIPIENGSFESPFVDPNAFPALPVADGWTELDNDLLGSTNTGVFANTAPDSWDHMNNADGRQLAFLGSQEGNGFEQDLAAVYQAGSEYKLVVGVGVSGRFPPSIAEPVDTLEIAFYYRDDVNSVDIARQTVDGSGLSLAHLRDFSVCLPAVQPDDAWASKTIGIAIRAAGMAGGFWDLDNVRLFASLPATPPALALGE